MLRLKAFSPMMTDSFFPRTLASSGLAALLSVLALTASASDASHLQHPLSTYPALSTEGISTPSGWRAQVTARDQAQLSAQMTGEIRTILRDGKAFKKGDEILSFDCAMNRARLARAEAGVHAAQGKLCVASDLRKLNSVSIADYEEARANAGIARAEADAERILVERCSVRAPFDGRVGESLVRPLEYVTEGTKILTIYADDAFELEAILPSHGIARLHPGAKMRLHVDELGIELPARVVRVSGIVDPVSQSLRVTAEIDMKALRAAKDDAGRPVKLLPGMSGTVRFDDAEGAPQKEEVHP